MTGTEITIRGAGIFGLSIAYLCARRGARVQVVDPKGVGSGSSGGPVGALAPHTPENWNAKKQFQLDSLVMAERFWAEVDALSGKSSGYARLGRLQSIANDRALELAQARCAGADALWRGAAIWEVRPAEGTWCPESATGQVVFDTLSARIHPRQACESLQHALRALGVDVLRVDRPVPKSPVIWATGYEGLLHLSQELARPVGNGVKGQALVLDCAARGLPQLFADGLHIVPHDNGTVAIGSTSERAFSSPTETDDQIETLRQRAIEICPVLANAPIVERWAGVRPRAKSRAPMLGPWPDRPGHFIANGGFKIGFGMAPKVAEVMTTLVLDGIDHIPDGFRVEDSL